MVSATLKNTIHLSIYIDHVPWTVHQALVKKKKSWNAKCVDVHEYDPNGHEISEMLRELALSTRLNFYFLSVVNYTRICKVCTHHDFKTLLFFWNYKL